MAGSNCARAEPDVRSPIEAEDSSESPIVRCGDAAIRAWCYALPMTTQDILVHVLALPHDERAHVAEELLASLEEPEADVAGAWAGELQRRSDEIREGRVEPVEWSAVRDGTLAEIQQRRAR